MGQTNDVRAESKGSKRGSVNNKARLDALQKGRSGGADWGGADAGWVLAVVSAITSKGGAIRFGYSKDGGAYGLGVFIGGEGTTLWWNGDVDLNTELEALYHEIESW